MSRPRYDDHTRPGDGFAERFAGGARRHQVALAEHEQRGQATLAAAAGPPVGVAGGEVDVEDAGAAFFSSRSAPPSIHKPGVWTAAERRPPGRGPQSETMATAAGS